MCREFLPITGHQSDICEVFTASQFFEIRGYIGLEIIPSEGYFFGTAHFRSLFKDATHIFMEMGKATLVLSGPAVETFLDRAIVQ